MPYGKAGTAFFYLGVIAVREIPDELVGPHLFCRPTDLVVADIVIAEPDVLSDRAAEEKYILQNDGKIRTQGFEIPFPDIDTVNEDTAFLNIVEPHDEVRDGRFS